MAREAAGNLVPAGCDSGGARHQPHMDPQQKPV